MYAKVNLLFVFAIAIAARGSSRHAAARARLQQYQCADGGPGTTGWLAPGVYGLGKPEGRAWVRNWRQPEDSFAWSVDAPEAGQYEVSVLRRHAGAEAEIVGQAGRLLFRLPKGWDKLTLPEPLPLPKGRSTITVRLRQPDNASLKSLKAGNPEAIVAFNPGVKVPVIVHTRYDDYTAGEVNLPQLARAIDACPGRWLECEGRKVQFQILTFLGTTWCRGDRPQLPDEQVVNLTRKLADKGGAVTFDVPIQKSGLIPQPFVEQLRAIGAAMVEKAAVRTDGPRPWPAERAWQWYKGQPWLCGFNYIPATAINYTEMWQRETFDPKTIDEELALAEQVRFNTLRCVLQYLVWEHDPDGFKQRMDQFLAICHKRGIRVVFCLFDDCVFGPKHDPYLGKQADVVPGWYAHDWSPSPGWSRVKDPKTWPKLQQYVHDVLTRFKDDPRVLMWDLYNEPTNGIGDVTLPLVAEVFATARTVNPSQPLTIGVWNGNQKLNDLAIQRSDVISFHRYGNAKQLEEIIASLEKHGRPLICTEWLKRDWGSVAEQLPVFSVIAWVACTGAW